MNTFFSLSFLKRFFSREAGMLIFLVFPASTNYQLKDFGFGTGGVSNATSSNYALDAVSGEQSAEKSIGGSYDLGSGLIFTNQANVPPAPTFTNPSNYYNKLKIVLDTGGNPSDTLFAIAISADDFVTTNYVQSDNTVGVALGLEDYQTYTTWGGAGGALIIGLVPSTAYKVKIKAWQGKFTETGYGPTATASTASPQFTFDIDVSASDTETGPPFTTGFNGANSLTAGTVVDSPEKVWVDFDTNGENGGRVYIASSNAGLQSLVAGYLISAVTGNLTGLNEGFGAQGFSAAQSAGGPFTVATAYDLTANNVAITDTTIREIFTTNNPTTAGRGAFLLKAKSSAVTPAASDYGETLTVVASASF